ncbi:heterocyst-inhibiting signaling peptide PatS [Nostoc sp. 'Peltigera membranacea cyanobiont' N6]|nr:heterocyst-inhibiting signaling peptide PatS [Nostoc sp. 'Peltigera membranacea cyanobiont' N6]
MLVTSSGERGSGR